MIALLVPLAAFAAPLAVLDDSEIGTWAQVPLDASEVEAFAALPGGGEWSGHGPYARSVAIDRLGALRVGGTVTTTGDDGAPVSCTVTGFGLVQNVFDDGERSGDPSWEGCSAPGIWAKLDCGGTAPGAIALPGDVAPMSYQSHDASAEGTARLIAALAPDLARLVSDAPGEPRSEVTVARWTSGDRSWLLVQMEAWVGQRWQGCGDDGWSSRAWGVYDEATLFPLFPLLRRDDARPTALIDADRDGRAEVLLRGPGGDQLVSPTGAVQMESARAVCVCTC